MKNFKRWYREHADRLCVASREDLALAAFQAGIDSIKQPEPLSHYGTEIKHYDSSTVLTLSNNDGFMIDVDQYEILNQEDLQKKLNTTSSVDIVEWILASKEKLCLLELSKGDVIDFSALSEKEGKTEAERTLLAVVQADNNYATITEIKPNEH